MNDKWMPLFGCLIMVSSLMCTVAYAGYKDRQFLRGERPRPVHEAWLCGLTVIVAVVTIAVCKWIGFFDWVDK